MLPEHFNLNQEVVHLVQIPVGAEKKYINEMCCV